MASSGISVFVTFNTRPVETAQSLVARRWSLGHGTFDEVHLAAVALWASKRSRVLAPHAWLNHRQSHGVIACAALRALFSFIEHARTPCLAAGRLFAFDA